ncbi:MAG TPA: hypothetical protein VM285_00990, partial [Polyangia bacterium]|nr:hypothetical protein [Polyangia bacterium]
LLPVELLLVDAASRGTALGLLLLAGEGALGAAIYAAALRVLAPGLGREFRGLIRKGRDRDGNKKASGDEEKLEAESERAEPI